MSDVPLAGVVVADEDHRFIRGRRSHVLHVDAQELVIEQPLRVDGVLQRLAADLPRQRPLPRQIVEKVVVEDPLRAVERIVGGLSRRAEDQQKNGSDALHHCASSYDD